MQVDCKDPLMVCWFEVCEAVQGNCIVHGLVMRRLDVILQRNKEAMWPQDFMLFLLFLKVLKESYLNFIVLSFSQGVEKLLSNLPVVLDFNCVALNLYAAQL